MQHNECGGRGSAPDATLVVVSDEPDRGAVQHGDTSIEYTVLRSRKRQRTIGITVSLQPSAGSLQQGSVAAVVVRAPLRASRAMVGEVVQRRAGWIARKLEEIARRREAVEGIHGRHGNAQNGTEDGVGGYELYRERALVVLEAAVERRAAEMGCSPSRVLVRNQKRQWGSCARDGTLRFNWRLVMLAPSLIDYVVVHELTHLRVRNHSPQFWSAVAEVLPDFKERRARLREMHLL